MKKVCKRIKIYNIKQVGVYTLLIGKFTSQTFLVASSSSKAPSAFLLLKLITSRLSEKISVGSLIARDVCTNRGSLESRKLSKQECGPLFHLA